jgi:hypothetical protein
MRTCSTGRRAGSEVPWQPSDAESHTHKAKSAIAKRQWRDVANGALARGESEGTAVREANGVIDRRMKHHRDTVKGGKRHPESHSEFERLGS